VHEGLEHFFAAVVGNVAGDEDKMEFALAAPDGLAAHEQEAEFDRVWKKALDRRGRGFGVHFPGFPLLIIIIILILILIPICASLHDGD
jgi:hypothetical protein